MDEIRIEKFLNPYVRFLNALPGNQKVDYYLGNTLVAPGLEFGCFSRYIKVGRGTQEIKMTESGNKENVIATVNIPFEQGDVYTVSSVYSGGENMAYGIAEPTERSNPDYGHVRVCHLAPGLGSLDISANEHKILGNIDYLEVSKYMCLLPGKYKFTAIDTLNGKTELAMPCQFPKAGMYNTVYIIGNGTDSAPYMGLFSVDAASYNGYYL